MSELPRVGDSYCSCIISWQIISKCCPFCVQNFFANLHTSVQQFLIVIDCSSILVKNDEGSCMKLEMHRQNEVEKYRLGTLVVVYFSLFLAYEKCGIYDAR